MRTIDDFYKRGYIYGKASFNRFNYSCAYSDAWRKDISSGVSILLKPHSTKVTRVKSTLKGYTLKYRRVKIDAKTTAHLEFVISGVGASKKNFQTIETSREHLRSDDNNNFLSVAVSALYEAAKLCADGKPTYWGNPPIPKATKKELINISKNILADWKGKVVGIILNSYNKEQLQYIQESLGLFKKKPFFVQEFNNLVHPEATNYLTLQLYRF